MGTHNTRKIKDKITEDSTLNQNTQRTIDLSKSVASNETSKKIKQIKGTRKWQIQKSVKGNKYIVGVPEKEKQNNERELIFKIMIQENVPEIKDLIVHIERHTM